MRAVRDTQVVVHDVTSGEAGPLVRPSAAVTGALRHLEVGGMPF